MKKRGVDSPTMEMRWRSRSLRGGPEASAAEAPVKPGHVREYDCH